MTLATNLRGLKGFGRNRGGNVAIIFAVLAIPVTGIASAAIDFGRAAKVRATLQTAVSSAAQAASAHISEERSVVEGQVERMLKANLPGELATLPHKLTIARDGSFVEVALQTTVPTTLMAVLGVSELAVEATGHARPVAPTAVPSRSNGGATPGREAPAVAPRPLAGLTDAGTPPVPAGLPARGEIKNPAELERALHDAMRQLNAGGGQIGAATPPAAAEVERMMREIRRAIR